MRLKHIRCLDEAKRKDDVYRVVCNDTEGTLFRLLEYIKSNGNTGHTFTIVVDPGSDAEKKFGWDGDGSDRIHSVERLS